MSASDHRIAVRRDATTGASTASGRADAPSGRPRARTGPVELPEIVPATPDGPVDEPPRPGGALVERDATEGWVEQAPPPVVVASPNAVGPPLRVRGRRPRVRKVTRTVRHLDPWSVFKVALVFSMCLYGVLLTSGVLIWNVASTTGTVANVERWFMQFGWETFELDGGEIFRNAWVAGLFGAVALTGAAVLVATLFNLVSDMVGGVRLTVLEEEVVERTAGPTRRYVVRRPAAVTEPTRADHARADHARAAGQTPPVADATPTGGAVDETADAAADDRPWPTDGPRRTVRTNRTPR